MKARIGAILILVCSHMLGVAIDSVAQPPGTMPPADLMRTESPWSGKLQGIRPEAFLFQDESNTPVVMPRMSFEEIDRLRKRDRGMQSGDRIATLERLTIQGQIQDNRTEMRATLLVRLDPLAVRQTGRSTVKVDLGLGGCHLIEPAKIQFANDQPADPNEGKPSTNIPGAYVRVMSPERASESGPLDDREPRASGADQESRTVGINGYQLVLPIAAIGGSVKPTTAEEDTINETAELLVSVDLLLSSRVQTLSPRQAALALQLPIVSTVMTFDLVEPRFQEKVASLASLEVSGTGSDVVRRIEASDRFSIEGAGGDLLLRWSSLQESLRDAGDLLEVESETEVQWESPNEPLTVESRLVTRNLRGALRTFEIVLPEGAVLLSPPEVGSIINGSQDAKSAREKSATMSTPNSSGAANGSLDDTPWVVQVTTPELNAGRESNPGKDEKKQKAVPALTQIRVSWGGGDVAPTSAQIRLKMRQVADEATANTPWTLAIPQVERSIGHRGFVTVRTPEDHRLRWRPKLGIDAVLSTSVDPSSNELVYPFRFSQTRFELPLWLSGKQEQLRLTAELNLEVNRKVALINMTVKAGGSGIDPKGLQLELGDWRLRDVRALTPTISTAASKTMDLDITVEDSIVRWQVDTSDGKWPSQYDITAELPLVESSLELPRIVSTETSTLVTDVNLSLVEGRRETWLVDLAASPALQRIDNSKQTRFRIISPENAWNLKGDFVTQPLQVDWSSAVVVSQTGDQWLTRSAWTLASSVNLEGRLRFAMPPGLYDSDTRDESGDQPSAGTIDPRWTVTVNGSPAVVRHDGSANGSGRANAMAGSVAASGETDGFFASDNIWEIVSPELDFGPHRIELELKQSILSKPKSSSRSNAPSANDTTLANVSSRLLLPVPLADRVNISSPITLRLPRGITDVEGRMWLPTPELDGILGELSATGDFQFDVPADQDVERANANLQWSFARAPDFAIPMILRNRLGEEQATEIPRAFLRSLIGKRYRHEHLLALVRKGQRVRLGLPKALESIRVRVRLDGLPIEHTLDSAGLRIDLPVSNLSELSRVTRSSVLPGNPVRSFQRREHLLDVRIWTESESPLWWSRIEPMIQLPVGSGLQYWQLVVPNDSHLFWASPQSGRAMRWEQTGLRLARSPSISDAALIRWTTDAGWDLNEPTLVDSLNGAEPESEIVGGNGDELTARMIRESLRESSFSVPGNRYLFFAGSSFSFSALSVSRTLLWLIVGGLVLLLALAFEWFPRVHHPITAFGLVIGVIGILVVAPDGVVLVAQLVLIAMCLVAVFYAVSAIAVPRNRQRVLTPGRARNGSQRLRSTETQEPSKRSRSETTSSRLNRRKTYREMPQELSKEWATSGLGTTREYDGGGDRRSDGSLRTENDSGAQQPEVGS